MGKKIFIDPTLTEAKEELINILSEKIVPCINQAADFALTVYELDEAITSRNPNYIIGVNSYIHLYSQFYDIDWTESPPSNKEGCQVTVKVQGINVPINVSKVDAKTRVPTSAKSLKKRLLDGNLLPGLGKYIKTEISNFELNIGYDVSIATGVGKITLDRVFSEGKRVYTINEALLFDSQLDSTISNAVPVPDQTIQTEYVSPSSKEKPVPEQDISTQYDRKKDRKDNEGKD